MDIKALLGNAGTASVFFLRPEPTGSPADGGQGRGMHAFTHTNRLRGHRFLEEGKDEDTKRKYLWNEAQLIRLNKMLI
jgi:hypothetical protein